MSLSSELRRVDEKRHRLSIDESYRTVLVRAIALGKISLDVVNSELLDGVKPIDPKEVEKFTNGSM